MHELLYVQILPIYLLRGSQSNDSQLAMSMSSTQIWVSKYRLLIKGTRVT